MLLQRVSKKQIVMRMLQNLHWYTCTRGFRAGRGDAGSDDRRGAGDGRVVSSSRRFNVELERWPAARRDFEKYLVMQPEAEDREVVVQASFRHGAMN